MLRAVLLLTFIVIASTLTFGQSAQQTAEGFQVDDMQGSPVSLESLRGNVVVMTFWSTRCIICHGEIPKLNQMADAFKGKKVTFLAVTMENQKKVEAYIKDNPFRFDIIPNGFGVLLKYAAKAEDGTINMPYPTFFVIGPEGEIALKTEGAGKTGQMSDIIGKLLSSSATR